MNKTYAIFSSQIGDGTRFTFITSCTEAQGNTFLQNSHGCVGNAVFVLMQSRDTGGSDRWSDIKDKLFECVDVDMFPGVVFKCENWPVFNDRGF